jgi:P4 family phage/plasmid primase-like protien
MRIAAPNRVIDLRAAQGPLPEPAEFAEPEEHAAAVVEAKRAWLSPPDRGLRNTRTLGVDYDAAADCPKFRAFVERIEPDPAARGYLQRAIGSTVEGGNWLQQALLLRGSGGNGKSTLLAVLGHVMGGYAAPCRIEMFLDGRDERAGQATPEEVDLPGARVMIASEPGARDVLSGKRIKSLTGGDPRPARGLGLPQFIYTPSAVPLLSFNRTPQIKDEDEGLWRRLEFVLFNVELHLLPQDERRDMGEVLAELKAEGPGILNWLLEGYAAARQLHPPPAVERFKAELRGASDPVGEFLAACVEDAPGEHIASRELHEVFTAWCGENGARALSLQAFGKLLSEKGLKSGTRRKAKHWLHKRLHPDAPSPVAASSAGQSWRDDA